MEKHLVTDRRIQRNNEYVLYPNTIKNQLIRIDITNISAGSKTNPGGYEVEPQPLEQFEISDERSPEEMEKVIQAAGYEAVWKNWDKGLD